VATLEDAEQAALAITCQRAGLADGQRILELGCGWGSLSLWMAERYPGAAITAVSNSHSQRAFIEARATALGLANLRVITADMNGFEPQGRFDRIVSVEMFEHMRNWRTLFARVADWLDDGGRFFMHVFCHRDSPYFFEEESESDWMTRYFFRGGMMPSADLPLHFQQHLTLLDQWAWNGIHYARTLEAWLARQDASEDAVLAVLAGHHGAEAPLWVTRWRLFYLACAELFRMNGGNEWFVGHYLLEKPGARGGGRESPLEFHPVPGGLVRGGAGGGGRLPLVGCRRGTGPAGGSPLARRRSLARGRLPAAGGVARLAMGVPGIWRGACPIPGLWGGDGAPVDGGAVDELCLHPGLLPGLDAG